jgi:hypothetical protein
MRWAAKHSSLEELVIKSRDVREALDRPCSLGHLLQAYNISTEAVSY